MTGPAIPSNAQPIVDNTGHITTVWQRFFNAVGLQLNKASSSIPSTATASGSPGEMAWDADYFYVCVAPNSWKRASLSTW
jgi:hypothetical protein